MKLYLSKLELAPGLAQNPYEMHRALWRCFPHSPDACRSFLYRVAWGRVGAPLAALVQSQTAPDTTAPADAVFLEPPKPFDTDRLAISPGDMLRFVLTVNPVKRLAKERCRVPLLRTDEREAWLRRKLEQAADVRECNVVASRNLHFRRRGEAGKVVIVTFAGVLQVKQTETLKALLVQGIGPAKSFGCGLLSLARA